MNVSIFAHDSSKFQSFACFLVEKKQAVLGKNDEDASIPTFSENKQFKVREGKGV